MREKLKSKAMKTKVKSKKLYCNFCGISKVHTRKGIWVLLILGQSHFQVHRQIDEGQVVPHVWYPLMGVTHGQQCQ